MSIFKDLEHIESSFTTCKQHKTGISDAFLALLKVLTRQENCKKKSEENGVYVGLMQHKTEN